MRIVEKMAQEKNAWNGKVTDWDYDIAPVYSLLQMIKDADP